jgi:hypothetical protein
MAGKGEEGFVTRAHGMWSSSPFEVRNVSGSVDCDHDWARMGKVEMQFRNPLWRKRFRIFNAREEGVLAAIPV